MNLCKNRKVNISNMWMTILVTMLLCMIIWAVFFLTKNSERIAVFAIVGVLITAITSVITVNITNQKAKDREYELIVMKEKMKVFEIFYNYFFKIFKDIRNNKKNVVANIDDYIEFKKGLMNWGSERMIKDFLKFDSLIQDEKLNHKEQLMGFDAFLKSIRVELNNEVSNDVSLVKLLLSKEAIKELGL